MTDKVTIRLRSSSSSSSSDDDDDLYGIRHLFSHVSSYFMVFIFTPLNLIPLFLRPNLTRFTDQPLLPVELLSRTFGLLFGFLILIVF